MLPDRIPECAADTRSPGGVATKLVLYMIVWERAMRFELTTPTLAKYREPAPRRRYGHSDLPSTEVYSSAFSLARPADEPALVEAESRAAIWRPISSAARRSGVSARWAYR